VVVDGSGDYVAGRFDGTRFEAETPRLKGDWGPNFYATMTFDGLPAADGRRIQMAWMRGGEYPDMPFNQQITFPCELTLRTFPDGVRMCRYPIREIERLHAGGLAMSDRLLAPEENALVAFQGGVCDIDAEFDLSRSDCEEIVFDLRGSRVAYDVAGRQLASCGSRAELAPRSGRLHLRILVDRMSVECFGNQGEVSITSVARAQESQTPWALHARGGHAHLASLAAHEVRSIWL
jgi:levanase/fructan beta-fructosidase